MANPKNNPKKIVSEEDWDALQKPPRLTAEQVIEWLEQYRQLMFEVWRNNPESYAKYLKAREYPIKNP